LAGMLLVAAIFGVPLLVVVAISAVLSGYIDRDWVRAIAVTAVFLLIPVCMTAAFRFAKRHAGQWPFS
jgi:hypothetical protein